MNSIIKKYTLITGACSGLGKAFAIERAAQGHPLILTALAGSGLHKLANTIAGDFKVDVQYLEGDMVWDKSFLDRLENMVQTHPINFLINNAGIGGSASFESAPEYALESMILLNVRSTALLTKRLVPYIKLHKTGNIVNVSSMAAFSPIAYKTVYPATKAFVSSLSQSLAVELHSSGIAVSVVYPGPMLTNSDTSRRIFKQGTLAQAALLDTKTIASYTIEKALSGKVNIIPGSLNRFSYHIMRFIPSTLRCKLISGKVKNELEPMARIEIEKGMAA